MWWLSKTKVLPSKTCLKNKLIILYTLATFCVKILSTLSRMKTLRFLENLVMRSGSSSRSWICVVFSTHITSIVLICFQRDGTGRHQFELVGNMFLKNRKVKNI
jgi:hypothetical protein